MHGHYAIVFLTILYVLRINFYWVECTCTCVTLLVKVPWSSWPAVVLFCLDGPFIVCTTHNTRPTLFGVVLRLLSLVKVRMGCAAPQMRASTLVPMVLLHRSAFWHRLSLASLNFRSRSLYNCAAKVGMQGNCAIVVRLCELLLRIECVYILVRRVPAHSFNDTVIMYAPTMEICVLLNHQKVRLVHTRSNSVVLKLGNDLTVHTVIPHPSEWGC